MLLFQFTVLSCIGLFFYLAEIVLFIIRYVERRVPTILHDERLSMSLRCKKCRQVLATQSVVTDGSCMTKGDNSVWYLEEDLLPDWIKDVVDEMGWQKGRLNCPKCGGRVGGFDFISGHKCGCGEHVVPSVHIVRSKVDSV